MHQPGGLAVSRDHDASAMFLQLRREPDGFRAIAGFARYCDVGFIFKNAPEAATHQAMIIHQQDRNFIRHVCPVFPPDFPSAP